ncbi:Solute carrier family 35 member SLC35F1/F2/F6 [Carpediemonas membranifera]|uniref:Solute carrier family 35 member SLC35F1/F2/F6 n=1 Tax=Carpediemonas membranifera TaxID=201153 RepID=A0A8J6ATT0_9EUKA|nr:Solute carrier family 35 member SLC35F1/F2/F6 [Carpediemonas membranifera]|eukprot:KAG9393943.1 Solute carrier family 35 member SLC35F1/F2/F6 [Carpediemonas membranifera]
MGAMKNVPTDLIINVAFAAGLLFNGCFSTISSKTAYQSFAVGIDNERHAFSKPWFQTLLMFLGMLVLLVMFVFEKVREYYGFLHAEDFKQKNAAFWKYMVKSSIILMAPGLFDLTATGISSMGLANPEVSSSVYQMLSGAVMVFSGLLSIIFLKTKLASFQWIGIVCCCIGLALVGLASFLPKLLFGDGIGDAKSLFIGMFDILLAQFLWSCQFVVEEFLLQTLDASAAQVVGMEGLYGTIIMSVLVLPALNILPGADAGKQENTLDTFVMLWNQPLIWIPNLMFLLVIIGYNWCGQSVTKRLSCVHRTILEACRSLFVWVVSVAIFYFCKIFGLASFGEGLTLFSIIQLAGFIVLTIGSLVHNEVIKIPGLHYGEGSSAGDKEPLVEEDETALE